MKILQDKTDKNEKIMQGLAFFLVFSICSYVNVFVSISMGLTAAYILSDCVRKRSFSGFYIDKRNWLGIAVFLIAVLAASLFSGDSESIHIALKYGYWAIPFLLMIYLGNQTDIKYAAVAGAIVFILGSGIYSLYQYDLFLQGMGYNGFSGRIASLYGQPNHYAMFLIGTLPLLILGLSDVLLMQIRRFIFIDIMAISLGIWALLKTGSRGAIFGFLTGCVIVFLVYMYENKTLKKFLGGLVLFVSLSGAILHIGIAGGMQRNYDYERMRLWQSSYLMWQDHKLLGVGLNNWQKEYQRKYILKSAKEKALPVPHNVMAWFFSTTGIIGGLGYLFFVFYYIILLIRKLTMEGTRVKWVLYAVLLIFISIHAHGMVDVGITHKGVARLVYLMLGLALCSSGTGTKEKSA